MDIYSPATDYVSGYVTCCWRLYVYKLRNIMISCENPLGHRDFHTRIFKLYRADIRNILIHLYLLISIIRHMIQFKKNNCETNSNKEI